MRETFRDSGTEARRKNSRERTCGVAYLPDIMFNNILQVVSEADLSCDEVVAIIAVLQKNYASKASFAIQTFPIDLWLNIFNFCGASHSDSWLVNRTVCQTWNRSILQMSCVTMPNWSNASRFLKLFNFSLTELRLPENARIDEITDLSKLRGLTIFSGRAYSQKLEWERLSKLDNLTSLSLESSYSRFNSEDLEPLTNLTRLSLDCSSVSSIDFLTNLTYLDLVSSNRFWCPLRQVNALTKLVTLKSNMRDQILKSTEISGLKPIYVLENDSYYAGEWGADCKPHGFGVYTSPEWSYQGQWENQSPHGHGKAFSAIDYYEGGWVRGAQSGKGECLYSDGTKVIGEWESGWICGTGECWYSDGSRYQGQWTRDCPTGEGTYEFAEGVYTGFWSQGKATGSGTFTRKDGLVFDGVWDQGKLGVLNPQKTPNIIPPDFPELIFQAHFSELSIRLDSEEKENTDF